MTPAEYYGLLVRVARVEASLKAARTQLATLTERVTKGGVSNEPGG